MDKKRCVEVARMISEDAKNDVKHFDGQPFTGKIVGEYMGRQAACIDALAKIIVEILEDE